MEALALNPPPLTAARHAARRVLRRAKYLLGDDPRLLPVFLRLTSEGVGRRITAGTDLVVEGFPRSGNTFAVFALRAVAPGLHVSSHVHHPAQVKDAVRKGVPTLLVVREPVECLASYLVYAPHGRPRGVLREYLHYHRQVMPLAADLVVATFDRVTSDLSSVIAALDDRFGLALPPFDQTPAAVAEVFAAVEAHHARVHPRLSPDRAAPRPSAARAAEHAALVRALRAPGLAGLLEEAASCYSALVG